MDFSNILNLIGQNQNNDLQNYIGFINNRSLLPKASPIPVPKKIESKLFNNNFTSLDSKTLALPTTGGPGPETKEKFDWSGAADVFGQGFDIANTLVKKPTYQTGFDKGLEIADSLSAVLPGPWGKIASGAIKGLNLLNNATGKDVEGSNNDISSLVNKGYTSENVADVRYSGTTRLFNKDRIQNRKKQVESTNTQNAMKANTIYSSNRQQNSANIVGTAWKNYNQISGNNSPEYFRTLIARNGAKLERKNVIPSGAFHSRKNNLGGEISENITEKGIPVITGDVIQIGDELVLAKGGEITQHAEVEKNEIIFHKELTLKLEELYKKYKENENDEILIEAGKLLTYEILENTDDNTNLINTI